MKHFLYTLFLLTATCSFTARAQDAPEQNCIGGIHVCQTTYSANTSYIGDGTITELDQDNEGCMNNGVGFAELNDVWFIITVSAPGQLVFTLTPAQPNTDYDWAMWDITGAGCSAIYNYTTNTYNPYQPIRCNASGNTGPTGMSTTACCPSEPGGNNPQFSSALTVSAGETYAICVSNWTQNSSGYTIDFTGSTASIFDTVKPTFSTITPYTCGNLDSIGFDMSESIVCSSLAADGSDFYITPGNATVVAAAGLTCVGAGSSTSTIGIKFSNNLPAGHYWLHAQTGSDGNSLIDNCGNSTASTDSIEFTVLALPIVTFGNDTTCVHDSLHITMAITNQTPGINYTYLWTPTQYINDATLPDPRVSPPVTTPYTVTISQDGTNVCVGNATIDVTVLQGFTLNNNDTTICKGATLPISVTGSSAYHYAWTPATWVTNPNVPNTTTIPDSSITYTVTASFPGCTDSSESFHVTVGKTPLISTSLDTTSCVNDTTQLHVYIANPNPNYAIAWSPNYDINNATVATPFVWPFVDTSYVVTVTDLSAGTFCFTRDTIRVTVLQGFNIITPDTAICHGQSFTISTVGDTRYHYLWTPPTWLSDPTIINPLITPDTTITYTLTASHTGCHDSSKSVVVSVGTVPAIDAGPDTSTCINSTHQMHVEILNGNPNMSVLWSPNLFIDDVTSHDPIISPPNDIVYVVTVTDNTTAAFCKTSDTVHVAVLQGYTIFNGDTAVCRGASIQFNGLGDTRYHYDWIPGIGMVSPYVINPLVTPDTSVVYELVASYPGCRDSVHDIKVTVNPVPTVYAGNNVEICEWHPIRLNGSVLPWDSVYIYRWSPGTRFNDSVISNPVYISNTSSMVHFLVTTPVGCTGQDSLYVQVWPGNFSGLLNKDMAICPHDVVTLTDTGGVSYIWQPSDNVSDTTSGSPDVSPITTTYYTVYATDAHGCLDTQNVNIVVHPAAVMLMPDSVTIYPGESYQISPESNCTTFTWFPPYGLTAINISNPVATPLVSTTYIVQAITDEGCRLTDSIKIGTPIESVLTVPNAFAPGTGPNAVFKIIKRGEATLTYFRIFNRWGVKVFETTDIDQGWNGQFSGKPQDFGVYVYDIEAVTSTGRTFHKQGNVTLVR